MNPIDNLLLHVQAKTFLAHDLLLYLDTHPDDRAAFEAYRHALAERREAVQTYEKERGALTAYGMVCRSSFHWVDEPIPWQ